jgi:universal stress protein A
MATGYRKIVALVDLSHASDRVIAAACRVAAEGAQIVLLHVLEMAAVEPMGESLMPTVQIEDELMTQARQRVAALLPAVTLPGARTRTEAGNTKAEVLRVANEEAADLIVLGTRERHGPGILVNFVEDTLLHAAHCDVLAVRLNQP